MMLCCLIITSIYAQDGIDEKKVELGFDITRSNELSSASTMTIYAEDLIKTGAINLQDALYGKLSGLNAFKTGGFSSADNYGASFSIRGVQTATENSILILVDGFERPIDRLDIHEVESVTVLKDAAAVALYGFRGVNGVLLVKTKRGEEGFSIDVGYDHKFVFKPELPQMVDAYTYANALNQARANDNLSPSYNQSELDAFKNQTDPFIYPNVNWADEMMSDLAAEDRVHLGINGGNDRLKYYAMMNYTDSRGLLKEMESIEDYSTKLRYSKANIRANIDYRATATTQLQINAAAGFIETTRPDQFADYDLFNTYYTLPSSAFPVKTKDALWGGNATYGAVNPVARIQNSGYLKNHDRSLYADAKLVQDLDFLLEGLRASVRVGYDNYSSISEQRAKGFEYASDRIIFGGGWNATDTVVRYTAGDKIGNLQWNRWLNRQWRRSNIVFTADYKKEFDDSNLNASFIYSAEAYSTDNRYNTFNRANWSAYVHYDRKERYIADLALVLSGSNRSYPQKFAFSPTLSVAWIASKENFLKDIEAIDLLKFRMSGGIQYSDYVPRVGIGFEDYLGTGDFFFGEGYSQQWGHFLAYVPNPDFKLETANKLNLGMDLKLWKSLSFNADFYFQRRSNILLGDAALNSEVLGLPAGYINWGVVDSKGLELGVNYQKSFSDFRLMLGALFSYSDSKLQDWIETPAYPYLSRIGHPVNQGFGFEAEGFFKDQAEIDNPSTPKHELGFVYPGDIRYKDQNADGVINENDVVPMGNPYPKINYSFSAGLGYKGVGINLLFQGTGMHNGFLSTPGVFHPMANNVNMSQHYWDNAWKPGGDNTQALYPRLSTQQSVNNNQPSTVWLANISFLKLRNCEVYYNIPSFMDNKFVKSARIYVQGENLLTFSPFDVMDPELIWTSYPILKAVNVGIKLNF
jgi:TonB-linked SusC/RagA family outer membrane protein